MHVRKLEEMIAEAGYKLKKRDQDLATGEERRIYARADGGLPVSVPVNRDHVDEIHALVIEWTLYVEGRLKRKRRRPH